MSLRQIGPPLSVEVRAMVSVLARGYRKVRFPIAMIRDCFAPLIFACLVFPSAFATGAGQSNIPCQGTVISPTDDIVGIINNGKQGQTFCIEGEHRISQTIQIRSGQSLIGTTSDSRISGAVVLSPWQATTTPGVYFYNGPYAQSKPHQQMQYDQGGQNICYWVSTYLDDIFFRTDPTNDQRIMRVLSQAEVDPTQSITTQGQAVTAGEAGRFFFDYTNHVIYVSLPGNQDPNTATVDLAISLNNPNGDSVLYGPGQTNVTLQNLFIEKSMNYGIYAGMGWTLKDMTVRFIHNTGIYGMRGTATQPATIDHSLLTNVGKLALNAALSANLTITNSEMSWNNIANFLSTDGATGSGVCKGYTDAGAFHIYDEIGTQKQPAVVINNVWSHDNIADGLWSDGGTQYTQITNSTFNGNERFGYFHEISCQVLFTGNTVYSNGYPLKNTDIPLGGGGVDVSDSNYGTFSSNLIYGNDAGFAFHLSLQSQHADMLSNPCLGANGDGDTSNTLKYNTVSSNAIYSCSTHSPIGKVWGPGGPLNSLNNQYQSNSYHFPDATSNWFTDATEADQSISEDWSAWQQGDHDTKGSLTAGCTYVPDEQVTTTTTLSLAPISVTAKSIGPVVVTAAVKAANGSGLSSGTVSFFNGTNQVGSATLNNGIATFNYNPSLLVAGAYSITATYIQNGSFDSSTSAPQTLTVQDFQIAANPATVTVSAPGGSGTTTLSLTPLDGFSQTPTYSCTGLPSGATCTFTPTSATAVKLTIQTTAPAAQNKNTARLLYAFLLPGLLGTIVVVGARKPRLRGMRLIALITLLTVSTLGMTACAGLANASHTNQATQPSSSSVTVTAATTGTSPLSHSVVVTLNVQ
jgi:hypothetical protein